MRAEANCEVTGKRKYLSEREALETAATNSPCPTLQNSSAHTFALGVSPGI
jgi:hypothetical protein